MSEQIETRTIQKGILIKEIDEAVRRRLSDQPIYTPFLSDNQTPEFSLGNAIRGQINGSLDGIEGEVHQELSRSMPVTPRGVVVPLMLLVQRTTMSSSNIGNLKQSIPRPYAFVDALQSPSAVMAAGSSMISGLEKSIVTPRQTGDATAAFTAEGSAVAESSLTFDSLTMTPKRISAKSSYTLETFMQSDPSIDQLIHNSQARKIGQEPDDNTIGGSGSSANPRGILNTSGINSISTGDIR